MSELKRGLHPDPTSTMTLTMTLVSKSETRLRRRTPAATKKFLACDGRRNDANAENVDSTLAVLPTMLTLGNGVCGLAAIAVAMSENVARRNKTDSCRNPDFCRHAVRRPGWFRRANDRAKKVSSVPNSIVSAMRSRSAPRRRQSSGESAKDRHFHIKRLAGQSASCSHSACSCDWHASTSKRPKMTRTKVLRDCPAQRLPARSQHLRSRCHDLTEYATDPTYPASIQTMAKTMTAGIASISLPALAVAWLT